MTTMEARLMGLAKRRSKDGDWFEIKIQVHPDEMPSDLYGVPLGTRIGVAMVQISEDEQEKPVKKSWDELSPSQQAGIRCNDPVFQEWMWNRIPDHDKRWIKEDISPSELTANLVRHDCRVSSRVQLDVSPSAAAIWETLNAEFEADTRLPEQR